jgi:hypothetical protein
MADREGELTPDFVQAASQLVRSLRAVERVGLATTDDARADLAAPMLVHAEVVSALEGLGLSPAEADSTAVSLSRGLSIAPHQDQAGAPGIFEAMFFVDGAQGDRRRRGRSAQPWVFVGAGGIVPLHGTSHTIIILNGTKQWHGTPITATVNTDRLGSAIVTKKATIDKICGRYSDTSVESEAEEELAPRRSKRRKR